MHSCSEPLHLKKLKFVSSYSTINIIKSIKQLEAEIKSLSDLKKDKEVFMKARKNNLLSRYLDTDVDIEVYDELDKLIV